MSGPLRRGMSGAAVLGLQRDLARAGFDPGPVDGAFGAQTERAARAFQRAQGLVVDGVVGVLTRAALSGGVVAPPGPGVPSGPPASAPVPAPGAPRGEHLTSIGGVAVHRARGTSALTFTAGMTIDADGSPRAYHPENRGLDHLANAGRPGRWWGLATDARGEPLVQRPGDPAPGYYVSTTALIDARFPAGDPRRYVDSERVPFIAVPPQLRGEGVKLGDLVAVRNERTGATVWAVVADIGPRDHLGEGSIRLAESLGINADARRGGAGSGVTYTVFPGSRPAWPMTHEEIQLAGLRLLGGE